MKRCKIPTVKIVIDYKVFLCPRWVHTLFQQHNSVISEAGSASPPPSATRMRPSRCKWSQLSISHVIWWTNMVMRRTSWVKQIIHFLQPSEDNNRWIRLCVSFFHYAFYVFSFSCQWEFTCLCKQLSAPRRIRQRWGQRKIRLTMFKTTQWGEDN